jgi:N-acetylneuraminate synthase/sialic acid synthase
MYNSVYNSENAFAETYGAHREFLEFDRAQYEELVAYAKALDITFFATAFDHCSADLLAALDMPAFKIASGDLTNIPLLRHVARFGRPMFVSTGGGTMDDVRRAYDAIMPLNRQLCIMQCTAAYPAPIEALDLRVIETFREAFPDIVIGFSGHESGIAMPIVAYMLGARVLEKHFTLNRAMKGTDHAFSLEPTGMRKVVRDLQRARASLGSPVKRRHDFETKPLYKMGKKLVAAFDLPAGTVLSDSCIAIKSPNDGLPPYEMDRLLGRRLARALSADEAFRLEDTLPS